MDTNKLTLLIVDDSEIDRMILKNILSSEYNVIEAANGYVALEQLKNNAAILSGMLLDISMPILDGFGVLAMMNKQMLETLPIILISAEANKDNIIKASNFKISNFIKKPYQAQQILAKLKSIFARNEIKTVLSQDVNKVTDAEVKASSQYAERLRRVYLTFLNYEKKTDEKYIHVTQIMHILLSNYYNLKNPRDLTPEQIEIISMASYFYDIGRIVIPTERNPKKYTIGELDNIPDTHTIAGADLIGVNSSPKVAYFVKIAADICMHHHERFDGRGLPHGLKSTINNFYTNMTSMTIDFCGQFFLDTKNVPGINEFNATLGALKEDSGAYRPDVLEILEASSKDIVNYYERNGR